MALSVSIVQAEPPQLKTELPKKVIGIKENIDKELSRWQIVDATGGKEIARYTVKTTFYYTCIEGDPTSGYSSFYQGVIHEGCGIAMRGKKLYHFYYDKSKKKIRKEPLTESNKRGYRARLSPGTLDIGDIAVPGEVYARYANHSGYLRTIKNQWLRVRIKDVGGDIQKRDGYIDVDVYAGTSGLALSEISERFFYDKYAVPDHTTELVIVSEVE